MENVESKSKSDLYEEFKKIAEENDVRRLEPEYLMRFLIGHRYDVFSALKKIKNFESFVDRRRNSWLKLKKSLVEKVISTQIVELLERTGLQGQLVLWIRVENWDPQYISADEILQVSGLLSELAYAKYKEIKSIDVLLDLHNLSLKHLYGLCPKFAKRMVFFMSECLPMTLLHIYVVRQPKIFYLVFSLFKPFLEEHMRKSIKICGWNFELLLVTIGRDNLPAELDGVSEVLDSKRWLNLFYNKKTQLGLRKSGYEFDFHE